MNVSVIREAHRRAFVTAETAYSYLCACGLAPSHAAMLVGWDAEVAAQVRLDEKRADYVSGVIPLTMYEQACDRELPRVLGLVSDQPNEPGERDK